MCSIQHARSTCRTTPEANTELTLVEDDEDSAPWLVGLGELGVADVEDGGDVVEVVVELLATVDLETGGGLDDVA